MSIYSNFFKNSFHSLCILKLDTTRFVSPILSTRVLQHIAATPEIKAAPLPELLHVNNVCELDTIPSDPGPNPGPEFPLPPNPSPPTPDGPMPPLPSPPGGPDTFPPNGPDVIPPKPGPPHPIKPDIPVPPLIMGSDGLAFY